MLSYDQSRYLVELTFPVYGNIRSEYWRGVNGAVQEYLDNPDKTDDWFKSVMRAIIELGFLNAALEAWTDQTGETKLSPDIIAFVTAYKLAEFGFVESLLLSLRARKHPIQVTELPEEELDLLEIQNAEVARKRADGYAKGLDIVYNNVKVRAAGERILLFTGDDGMESCFDCQKYKGLKKPASWWVRNNAVPPNRDFECKGYNCLHILKDVRTGRVFTI